MSGLRIGFKSTRHTLLLAAALFILNLSTNATASTDALTPATCQGGTLPVCGQQIPMPGLTSIGNTAEVHVPSSMLGDPSASLSFTVECLDNGYGAGSYAAADIKAISCNAFPCQTQNVRICETSIPVQGGTPMGGTVAMTMPAPFAPEAFTVQCVGNQSNPPIYQITDHHNVTCSKTQ